VLNDFPGIFYTTGSYVFNLNDDDNDYRNEYKVATSLSLLFASWKREKENCFLSIVFFFLHQRQSNTQIRIITIVVALL